MILILGGAYQGKLAYAKERFGLTERDIFSCTSAQIDFSRPCITNLEKFVQSCVTEGRDPKAHFQANQEAWRDSVLICRDIFCGVVPTDPILRETRQSTGWLCQYLTKEADSVVRIFCGLEQRLK